MMDQILMLDNEFPFIFFAINILKYVDIYINNNINILSDLDLK